MLDRLRPKGKPSPSGSLPPPSPPSGKSAQAGFAADGLTLSAATRRPAHPATPQPTESLPPETKKPSETAATTCRAPDSGGHRSRETHRVKVEPVAASVPTEDEGYAAYAELQKFDTAVNPHSVKETERLAKLATEYQQAGQAQQLTLPVEGGRRTLTISLAPGIDAQEALQVVQRMYEASHPAHRQALREVHFYTGSNPMDEYYELRAGFQRDFVSEMTGGNGAINFYNVGQPDHPQCQDLWDHELAHVYMQQSPAASEEAMVPAGWAEAIAADRADGQHEFVSDYARVNRTEDFAETYRKYVEAQRSCDLEAFRKTYPARAAILDKLFLEAPEE